MSSHLSTYDHASLPLTMSIKRAVAVSGISKTELYRRAGTGELDVRKMRSSTLIVTRSLLDMIEGLPKMTRRQ